MSALTRRLARLEEKTPDSDGRIRVIFVSFCERGEGGELVTRLGLAQLIGGPNLLRDDDETEGAFARRVYAALTPDKPRESMTREELEITAAGLSEAVALAKLRGEPIDDDMLRT